MYTVSYPGRTEFSGLNKVTKGTKEVFDLSHHYASRHVRKSNVSAGNVQLSYKMLYIYSSSLNISTSCSQRDILQNVAA
jgi:hypothetical protein